MIVFAGAMRLVGTIGARAVDLPPAFLYNSAQSPDIHCSTCPAARSRRVGTPSSPSCRALREIPYNYTSFSDREIVIRLLGAAGLAHPRRAARRASHRAFGAHAVRSARRHLGRAAQSVPAGRPDRQPEASAPADRGAASPAQRSRAASRCRQIVERDRKVGELLQAARQCVRSVRRAISNASSAAAQARTSTARTAHARRQHPLRCVRARLARDRRHRLAHRVSVRGARRRTPKTKFRRSCAPASSSG